MASILINSNTAVQNVIVELQYQVAHDLKRGSTHENRLQSVYVGWTGIASQDRATLVSGSENVRLVSSREIGTIEIDVAFGRAAGLVEGQKVNVMMHVNPSLAHTIHIEPLTPGDWEIIELHANFLETNLQAQIRAIPNPLYKEPKGLKGHGWHPLTLHLSPTSTANILISSITPSVDVGIPFLKIAPDAEVIVTPKLQPRAARVSRTGSRSIASVSQKSGGGGKSGVSLSRLKNRHNEPKHAIFLRGLDQRLLSQRDVENGKSGSSFGLRIWLDPETISSSILQGSECACVSIVQPTGTQPPVDSQQSQKARDQENKEVGKYAAKILAMLEVWNYAPDSRHVLMSPALCEGLGMGRVIGGIVRIEPAPNPIPKSSVKALKIYPFLASKAQKPEGLKFRSDMKFSRDATIERIKSLYGTRSGNCVLAGPLTDGLILRTTNRPNSSECYGALLRFEPSSTSSEIEKATTQWIVDPDETLAIEVHQAIPDPVSSLEHVTLDNEQLPTEVTALVGIGPLIDRLLSNLVRQSSLLLNGGSGSGKTSLARLLGYRLRQKHLFYVSYLNCGKLVADDVRSTTVKEIMERIFIKASWGSRLGGKSVVILDDLDKLCPAENELQVGGENGRSRQLSELFCSIVRRYRYPNSKVLLLATSQGKDALNSAIIAGHILSEVMDLKAPDKEQRRRILDALIQRQRHSDHGARKVPEDGSLIADGSWSGRSSPSNCNVPPSSQNSTIEGNGLDFREIAGQTDGCMPGDLVLLISRARGEALIRIAKEFTHDSSLNLIYKDFQQALIGFKPASLRNVTLQSSSTKFSSIGGLEGTRKMLLETLQYPTKYAPIFAKCPLRLRSGLLLYGYPGCGKTLLASAVAGECGLNFISVKGPEILNKYIGASEKSVRDLFERAEAARPCVLFFDEFDSIAPKRGHDSTGVTDRVVNQLLTQMDGAEGLSDVYVLAATSRPDLIDPALLRPGRLDKSLLCDMPSAKDRLSILHALSYGLKIDQEVLSTGRGTGENLVKIATRTEGYSGADLQAVIYNAHLEAIHDVLGNKKSVLQSTNRQRQLCQPIHGDFHNNAKEFMEFPFSEEEEPYGISGLAQTQYNRIHDNSTHLNRLEALKIAKHNKRSQVRTEGNTEHYTVGSDYRNLDITIRWRHLEASLLTTRSSISATERQKLANIYHEFVIGRNGEMSTGQGPTEVGQRSSLM